MGGWKTWVAVIGGIGSGLGMIAKGLLADPPDIDTAWKGLILLFGSFGILGVGHKADRILKAMKK